jgi:autotransporter passenger strand-loop-strand repeat protein
VNVEKGGTAYFIGVSAGAALNVAGIITSDVTVFAGGVETVLSGGVVSGSAGAGTAISGTVNVLSGGKFSFSDVDSGGRLNVSRGGTAHDISVSSGGALNVAGAITSDVTVFSGGVETVSSGGIVSDNGSAGTLISGTVNVLSGGPLAFADIEGGQLNVSKGGAAHDIFVSSGSELNVAGTTTSNITVFSGGIETVSFGGVVTGASAARTTISGEVDLLSGGRLGFATVSSGGALNVSDGGSAANIIVSSGGTLNVAGTTTSNVTVSSGGMETVSSGGVASGTTIAGGTLEISNGGSDGGKVTFAANTGTLLLDSTTFGGTVAGMTGQDTIDLRNFNFATAQVTSSVTAASATLTVSAGGDVAQIILIGNYMASTFSPSNDGFGGTSIVDPHVSASQAAALAQTYNG